MSKGNDDVYNLINPLISEILKSSPKDNVKIDIIKEEIKNKTYQINSKNIAKKFLELTKKTKEEVPAE